MSVEGETGTLQYIVVGIGVNVNQQLSDFPEELRSVAGSVAMAAGHPIDRGRLAAEIVNAMDRMYADWLNGVWSVDRYRADCATLGREVRVIRAGGEREAVAEAVDDEFGLVVRYPDGTRETVFSDAPAHFKTCAHALSVAPEVVMSSTSRMRFSRTSAPLRRE